MSQLERARERMATAYQLLRNGADNATIAQQLDVRTSTVLKWRRRFGLTRYLNEQAPRRYRGIKLLQHGVRTCRVALICQVPMSTVKNWSREIQRGRTAHSTGGVRPRIAGANQRALVEALAQGPRMHGYLRDDWTGEIVADLAQRMFGITLTPRSMKDYLRRSGIPWTNSWALQAMNEAMAAQGMEAS